MKKIYSSFYFLLVITTSFAQNKETVKADKLFDTYQYVGAIDEYLKLAENKNANAYIYIKLAESYYNIFNPEEAAKWYEKAVSGKSKQDPEVYYRYAQTLKSLGKYKEANVQMETFSKLSPNDSRAKEYLLNPNYIPSLSAMTKLFDVSET